MAGGGTRPSKRLRPQRTRSRTYPPGRAARRPSASRSRTVAGSHRVVIRSVSSASRSIASSSRSGAVAIAGRSATVTAVSALVADGRHGSSIVGPRGDPAFPGSSGRGRVRTAFCTSEPPCSGGGADRSKGCLGICSARLSPGTTVVGRRRFREVGVSWREEIVDATATEDRRRGGDRRSVSAGEPASQELTRRFGRSAIRARRETPPRRPARRPRRRR